MRPESAVTKTAENKEIDAKHPAKALRAAKCEMLTDKQGKQIIKFAFKGEDNQQLMSSAIKNSI
jgi:hypothetical protein